MEQENATIKLGSDMVGAFNNIISDYKVCVAKIAKNFNLYVGQTEVLFLLKEKSGWTQKDLAKELGVSKATIGVSLRRMELAGLVNRVTDLQDARCIRVSLTDKGMQVCEKCDTAFKQIYDSMFKNFYSKSQKEALEILSTMSQGLSQSKKAL